MKKITTIAALAFAALQGYAQIGLGRTTPMMGWASWNHFQTDISDAIIKGEADALVSSGLKDAGYQFINIDDSYYLGRDKNGNILPDKTKFPHGLKDVADYIHSKGLKAGIYTDAGISTCAAQWSKDTANHAEGIYGHEAQDLTLFLKTWGYDFLKVDWCGGLAMKLDEQLRYTQIAEHMKKIKPEAILNICRWQFPGKWAPLVAGSWRISGDISNNFASILKIIDLNVDLWKYCTPGHFNDMDMLQVGRGMGYEEDKSHFSMWCILNSPLLLGNDLRNMSKETLSIISNKEVIALNQDPFCYQARRLHVKDSVQVWARPLVSASSGEVAVALLNTGNTSATFRLNVDSLGINVQKGYIVRDLWKHQNQPSSKASEQQYGLPPHGTIVLKITGVAVPFNVFEKG
ncbi:MAG: glycoside hydrolase family 27 protein [Chitinophagaceae bacterium]